MTSAAKNALLMALAFAIAVGSGAFLSATIDAGGTTRVLPATDEPIPVLAPIAAGPEAPPFSADTSGGSGGGGASGGGQPPPDASVTEPVSTGAPSELDDPALAGLGEGADPGDPVEPLLPDSDRVLRGPHFEDPCTLRGGIVCGIEGIPGTVLGGDEPAREDGEGEDGEGEDAVGRAGAGLYDPPPLWVSVYPGMAPGGPFSSRCAASDVAEGERPVTVLVLNPSEITLEWRGYAVPPSDPPLGTLRASSAEASHPEHRRWRQWVGDGTLNSTIDHRIQHCFGIPGLSGTELYRVRVRATDIYGQDAQDDGILPLPASAGRPPTIITAVDDGRVAVRAAHESAERVEIRMYPDPPGGASPCIEAERAGAPEERAPGEIRSLDSVPIADDAARGTGRYTYDPPAAFSLHEGTRYAVCLWWSTAGTRSFDPRSITLRETHSVTSPNRYGVRIGVEGVSTNRDIDAGGIALEVVSGSDRRCRSESTSALAAGEHPDFTLDVCRLDDGSVVPDRLGLLVVGPHGRALSYAIDVPGPCRPGRGCAATLDQWYHLTIPNEVAARRLCGGDCDPPSPRERAGTAHVHAVFVDGPSDGGSSWDIGGGPNVFSGAPAEPGELPPFPRLDTRFSQVIVVDAHTFRIRWGADRPVTVRGTVTNRDGGPPCLRSGDGTFTTTTLATTGVNEIGGLCANTPYSISLALTGAAGESHVFGPGGPATWPGQAASTPGFFRRVAVDIIFDAPPGGGPDATWHAFGLEIDGFHGYIRGPSGCTFATSFTSASGPSGRATLGDVATIDVNFLGRGPCGEGVGRAATQGSTRFTRELTLEELDAGVTLDSPAGDTLVAHVTLRTFPT